MMVLPSSPSSLFKFLTVLETNVWLCILAAYFFTRWKSQTHLTVIIQSIILLLPSFLMWVFDRYSPYSYQNNRDKYKDDDEKREFTLKECLWFCMTSLTPQGGGKWRDDEGCFNSSLNELFIYVHRRSPEEFIWSSRCSYVVALWVLCCHKIIFPPN